jgi:site-specific DNA recombinase
MSRDEMVAVVTAFSDLAQVVQQADPRDKADIYAQLRLTLTYQPEEKLVQATIKTGLDMCKGFVSEGGLEPGNPRVFPDSALEWRYFLRCGS